MSRHPTVGTVIAHGVRRYEFQGYQYRGKRYLISDLYLPYRWEWEFILTGKIGHFKKRRRWPADIWPNMRKVRS